MASGFVPARPAEVYEWIADLDRWPTIFPGWIASAEADDERWRITGPGKEKYDFYPHPDRDRLALDVEVVDELGSGDILRLRVLDMPGGALVLASHGKLSGTSDAAWQQKRDGVAAGLSALSLDSPRGT